MTDSAKFEGLRSTNYYSWREFMKAALILVDLWSAVEEDANYHALDAAGQAKMKAKATALIQVKISSELKHLVTGAASAKVAWKALEDTFKAQSVGRKSALRQQLKELRRKKTEDVLIYISRAEILRTEFKDACNETVPDDAFIHDILDGLGSAYKEFVRQYRYGNKALTLQELKSRLLFVAVMVQHDDDNDDDDDDLSDSRPAHAFQVAAQRGRGSQYAGKNGACHVCGKNDHWKRDCPLTKACETSKRPGDWPGTSVAFVAVHSRSIPEIT
jgi:hypothetical protein